MITNLHDLYIHQLKDLCSAEDQILEALPKMIDRASDEDLREAFEQHLEETREQRRRLDTLTASHSITGSGDTCQAIKGILKEGEDLMAKMAGDVVDAGLIAAAQRVEHYEIAAYGTAKEYADKLGYSDDVSLLDDSLDEEGNANRKLTTLATGGFFGSGVNETAIAGA